MNASADLACQERILQGVSRTFALTIPQLPPALSQVTGNAYLLCRIADTIEDDRDLPLPRKREFAEGFIRVVAGAQDAAPFAQALGPLLSSASAAERELVRNAPAVLRLTKSFNPRQRAALERCIRIMAAGMAQYQEVNARGGLQDQQDMDRYCYFVAGVVGELLTELFCDYSAAVNRRRDALMKLAPSFGQGLQMTNILKDIWDDQKRNMCWLPQSVLKRHGTAWRAGTPLRNDQGLQQALLQLTGVARGHLENALNYTLLVPKNETGIRRFCLWGLGMAALTLRKINANPGFTSGAQVKISRRSVKAAIISTNLCARRDLLLRWLFNAAARPLPAGPGQSDSDSRPRPAVATPDPARRAPPLSPDSINQS